MVESLTIASAEINDILKFLTNEQVNKIPEKLRIFFKKSAKEGYISNIDPNKSILEQDITPQTKDILIMFYRKYWSNEEQKNRIDEILIQNEKAYQEKINKKYNVNNIFENTNNTQTINIQTQEITQEPNSIMVIEKETIWQKVIGKIKKIFNKK